MPLQYSSRYDWNRLCDGLAVSKPYQAGNQRAPSVGLPERLTRQKKLAFSFGETTEAVCFPESHPPAIRLPESFRGGCSFGDGTFLAPSLPQVSSVG